MEKEDIVSKATKLYVDDLLHKIMNILETEDGRTFEEKKKEALSYLQGEEDTLLAEKLLDVATDDENGKRIKARFGNQGLCAVQDCNIVLRRPEEKDKDYFIALQTDNALSKAIYHGLNCQELMWKEHIEHKTLMCTIECAGEYVGYCGIKNVAKEPWELAIEILSKWRTQGIGTCAVRMLLDNVRKRLDVTSFRVRIEPNNYASQALFAKLGAKPNGISEFLIYEEEIAKYEEYYIDSIDDRLIDVAKKFEVEPRELLSHVLEYKLEWNDVI